MRQHTEAAAVAARKAEKESQGWIKFVLWRTCTYTYTVTLLAALVAVLEHHHKHLHAFLEI